MGNLFGKKTANDVGDWTSNKEMNPAANSSTTEDGLSITEERGGEQSWRDAKIEDETEETEKEKSADHSA